MFCAVATYCLRRRETIDYQAIFSMARDLNSLSISANECRENKGGDQCHRKNDQRNQRNRSTNTGNSRDKGSANGKSASIKNEAEVISPRILSSPSIAPRAYPHWGTGIQSYAQKSSKENSESSTSISPDSRSKIKARGILRKVDNKRNTNTEGQTNNVPKPPRGILVVYL